MPSPRDVARGLCRFPSARRCRGEFPTCPPMWGRVPTCPTDERQVPNLPPHGRRGTRFMAKHIFVTGGVVSSLGKGLTCASIGMLLEQRGLRVRLQKFDPYINVDPGTMSPYQHGEVYVLDDGAETDLDLGHYERFTNAPLTRDCNLHHRQDLPLRHPEGTPRRLPGQDRPGDPARHRRDQGGHPQAGRPTTSTSSSPRSAAPSATSRACRSSKRSASSPSTSASRTASTST